MSAREISPDRRFSMNHSAFSMGSMRILVCATILPDVFRAHLIRCDLGDSELTCACDRRNARRDDALGALAQHRVRHRRCGAGKLRERRVAPMDRQASRRRFPGTCRGSAADSYRSAARVYIDGSSFGPDSDQIARSGIGSCGFTLPSGPCNWAATHFEHCLSSVSRMRCSISAGVAMPLSAEEIASTLDDRQSKMMRWAR